jgi:sterol desaturase/sphingolipid hydroxylase (fatty acid hydroxylase superfamily)
VFFVLPITWLGYDPAADFSTETIPAWWVSALQLLASSMIYNFGFYWFHRLLHHK